MLHRVVSFLRRGRTDLTRRYGSAVVLASLVAAVAMLGGSWGVALGQTTPPAPPAPPPAPTSDTLPPAPPQPTVEIPPPAPTVQGIVPTSPPAGVPTVGTGGVIGVVPPTPGAATFNGAFTNGSTAQIVVDNRNQGSDQGQPVAVRFEPLPSPPSNVTLPPNTTVTRTFSLEVLNYDPNSNTATGRTAEQKAQTRPVTLTTGLTAEEFASMPKLANGSPDSSAFSFLRVKEDGTVEVVPAVWSPDPAPNGSVTAVFVPRSTYMLALLPPEQRGRLVPADSRYFDQTGFRVNSDSFWDYFQKRGGVRTFGYPISREFTLMGFGVQMFQRAVLQSRPDGSVARLNILDAGVMPYTQINFSTFPAPDPDLISSAPQDGDPAYGEKAIAFVTANVPDQWDGKQVNFGKTFLSTVTAKDAFPNGNGEEALLPLFNLEVWGLPTSKPAYDPNNKGFVYQRFQRGIMHYDASTGETQGLLLGDNLKSIMTGKNLPPDLDVQAQGSPFYKQYDVKAPGSIAKPGLLGATNLTGAFEKEMTFSH